MGVVIYGKSTKSAHLRCSKICVNDAYLFALLRYIHKNPVRAGITETPAYRWSSHDSYLKGFSDLVDADFILSLINENKEKAMRTCAHLMQAPAAKVDVQPAFLSQNNEEEPQNSGPEEIPSLSMDNLGSGGIGNWYRC